MRKRSKMNLLEKIVISIWSIFWLIFPVYLAILLIGAVFFGTNWLFALVVLAPVGLVVYIWERYMLEIWLSVLKE